MPRKKSAPRAVVTCPRCGLDADPSAGPLNFCPGCGVGLREATSGPRAAGALASRVIADRYRLRELIGEGGMGAVYKAEHIRMGKALALKILRGDFAREPGAVERFLAEARIVSRLSHPHTIAVFDFGEVDEDGSGFYLAMEYVPGKDLAAVLRESGRLPERRVADIGQQILGSLAEAHDAGIVHRDVKPGNVMLMQTRSGEDFVKVLDFGIAKLRERPDGAGAVDRHPVATTSTGAIVGTPNYLAPEQARAEPIDGRSDLYAVGCLLYELAAGKPPFVAPSPIAVVAAHLHEEPAPLAQQAPGISRAFADVVHRALRKRAEERFASADEMRAALHALSQPSHARRASRPGRPGITGELPIASREDFAHDRVRALRQRRVLAPLIALLVVAAGIGIAWRGEAYSLLATRAPGLASKIPPTLLPSGIREGGEQEPNDVPARANPLALPPGRDGTAAAGTALVHGHIGKKLSEEAGDVDVYRIEIPAVEGTKVLVAEWHAEGAAEGIRGLDVVLALNRELGPGDGGGPSAPLVASVDRGGPGRAEALAAAVAQGAYYLSVREQHDDATGPVEKPGDRYVLEVRLSDPAPGEEVEPNDRPERTRDGHERYPEWRAVAERNPLAPGAPVRAETRPDDPDLYAVGSRGAAVAELVVAVPDPGLALSARLWRPDTEDLLSETAQHRVRFEDGGDGSAGGILAVKLDRAAPEGAPALLQLHAGSGQGRYEVVALGRDAASGAAVLALTRSLAESGRTVAALELAAAFAGSVPEASGRGEVLRLAAAIAERAAPDLAPDAVPAYDRAAQLLGAAIFEPRGGKVVYRGAFGAAPDAAPAPATSTTAR